MRIDTALNLFWAVAAIAALGSLGLSEIGRRASLRSRLRRVLAVFVAAVALFPSISASDDFARFAQLQIGAEAGAQIAESVAQESNDKPALYLARLAEALESLQISAACGLLVTLCLFAFVAFSCELAPEQSLPTAKGRGPPLFAFA